MNTLIFLGIIYVISIIGAIISIRYDKDINENSYISILIFCPLINTGLCLVELLCVVSLTNINLDKVLYKLITYKI